MPSFAESLEATLHNALKHAGDRAHEYATLEHLLLALIDDADAAKVMQACGVDVVLESDGDTGKQLGRIPACTRGICCDCLFEHLPGIARNKGIERNRIWLTAQEFSDIFSGGKSALDHVSPGFNDG